MSDEPTAAHTGAYIMAFLSESDSKRLSVEGGSDPSDMHITLGYFEQEADDINPETRAIIQYNLRDIGAHMFPVPGDVFARAQLNFGPDGERPSCSVMLVQSPELANVHTAVGMTVDGVAGLTLSTKFPIWIPHITVGYNTDLELITPDMLGPITFDRLIVSWGEEKVDVTEPLDQAYHVDVLSLAAA